MEFWHDRVLVLDFGSQYTQLIARRIREAQVYSQILPYSTPLARIQAYRPKGIILSGGPASVYDQRAPLVAKQLFEQDLPVLGICYGMQLITHVLDGEVAKATRREYGRAELLIDDDSDLFKGVGEGGVTRVWMSHGDRIERLPKGFRSIARTSNSPIAAMKSVADGRRIYCLQFHPEVAHTVGGFRILQNFVHDICGCKPTWTMSSYVETAVAQIRDTAGKGKAICGLSGGVDSAVAAALAHRAIGERLTCIFVDHGLLRLNEREQVERTFRAHLGLDLRVVDAAARFLAALRDVEDPEEKRRRIGHTFIDVFEDAAQHVSGDVGFLVQGTLYPDVIESASPRGGPSVTIKTHHNVGGLRPHLPWKLIEPLRELFKDEVRQVGRELGLPEEIVGRHPFPGPGLAIRVLGPVTEERLDLLRRVDAIYVEEIRSAGL